MRTEPPRAIEVVDVRPLGDVPPRLLDALVRRLSRRLGVPCRQRGGIADDELPRLQHRPQLDADATLARLGEDAPPNGAVVVGVTTEDLGHPLFTFFFGRARIGGACVVSLHRLDPAYYGLPADEDLVLTRATLECLHELGHVAGLVHCDDYRCVMHFSGDVESIDLRGQGLCERCAATLPRPLRHALHG